MRRAMFAGLLVIFAVVLSVQVSLSASESYNYYFGNLHAHTSYSDGMGTPSEAFAQVSTAGGMDFFALTEHGYYFQELTNIHLWYKSIEEADLFYKKGEFVSLVGYEWTHSEGHMNGYGTPKAASRDTQRDLAAFIDYLHEYKGFATFNHPNPEIQPNWNDFSYWSRADQVVAMIEVGSGAYYRNTRNEPSYIKALDRGWKVGAVNNQDNHRDDWGRAAEVRTGLVAHELTRESVMDAMRNMHTYSTEDRNVRVLLSCGDSVMGDTVSYEGSFSGSSFDIRLFVMDPDGERLSSIKLITNGGRAVSSVASPEGTDFKFKVSPDLDYSYFYAKIVQADGDTIITSPIWIETGSGIVASDFRMEDVFVSKGRQATFYVRVADRKGEQDLTLPYVLLADYGDGFIEEAEGTVEVEAGRWSHLLVPWTPVEAGKVELKVVLKSVSGDQLFVAGKYEVLEKEPMGFAIDEGHNNRMTSYYKDLIALAKEMGYEGRIFEDLIKPDALSGVKALIIPLPEQGFALKPTYYEADELKVISDWVKDGGSLLLVGWADAGDGSRDPKDFNLLLEMLGSGIEFGQGMLAVGNSPAKEFRIALPSGTYMAGLLEAAPILIDEGASGFVEIAIEAEGMSASSSEGEMQGELLIAVAMPIGKGRLVAFGSVPFSDFELGKRGFDNTGLTKAILRWLFEGRW